MKISLYKLILGLVLFISSAYNFKSTTGTGIVIIVNKENPVTTLSVGEVKLYWLRKIKKRWPEINKNIKPVDRKSKSGEQDTFYSKVLNMSAADVETYFIQKQYESAEKPQDKFSNDAAIIEFVGSEPGAIGFVSKGANLGSDVKVVLTID